MDRAVHAAALGEEANIRDSECGQLSFLSGGRGRNVSPLLTLMSKCGRQCLRRGKCASDDRLGLYVISSPEQHKLGDQDENQLLLLLLLVIRSVERRGIDAVIP